MVKWRDITSYSKDDIVRTPTTFECRGTKLAIVVTKGHVYFPGSYVMNCFQLGIDTKRLESTDLESAKLEALRIATQVLDEFKKDLDTFWYTEE